jgi:hypothetical protein
MKRFISFFSCFLLVFFHCSTMRAKGNLRPTTPDGSAQIGTNSKQRKMFQLTGIVAARGRFLAAEQQFLFTAVSNRPT